MKTIEKHCLEQMQGLMQRRAALVSTLVAVRSPQDPEPLIATGRAVGEITTHPIGDKGFGFDPVMWIPALGKTFAQMPEEQKNAIKSSGASRQGQC
jgi:XTP/dITP diphosphohydrolase